MITEYPHSSRAYRGEGEHIYDSLHVMVKAPVAKVKSQFQEYEDMEFSKRGNWTLVEDCSGTQLFGWEVSDWIELAGDNELIYAYYDEDMSAEFIHIKNGVCLRAYQEYDGELDIDEG